MSVVDFVESAGVTLGLSGGRVLLRGLDLLDPEVAHDIVTLVRANKTEVVKALDSHCPYTADQLDAFAKTHPDLVCCPRAGSGWWWREVFYCASKCPAASCHFRRSSS